MSALTPVKASNGLLRRWLVPSLPDLFFVVLLVSAFVHPRGLQALLCDGDTGWHIRTGELVIATGRAPVADPFSFTRPNQAWFAWEWLSDVIFARVWRGQGLGGVAALAGALIGLAATLLLVRMLGSGTGLWLGIAATMAAVSASSVHYLARPHVFSILLYTLALGILYRDRERRSHRLWLLPPLTALWANLHAGFVAWLATLALLLAFGAVRREWKAMRRHGALLLLCSLASLVNPFGWRLHAHVVGYLNSPWILDHVQEFQSPHIRSEGMLVFAALLLASVAVAARADAFEGLLVLVWGFLALRSARHVPFFAIVAAPVVAAATASAWKRLAALAPGGSPLGIFWELGQEFGRAPRISVWLPVSALAAIAFAPAVGFPDTLFPVSAVERNLPQLTPRGTMPRILTSDQWADYLIYRLYPRQRVFFDGRSDFFGPALGADYRKLMGGERPWRELLERYQFELALLPRDWALSETLDGEPGWQRVYEDPVAVLFAHRAEGGAPLVTGRLEKPPRPLGVIQ